MLTSSKSTFNALKKEILSLSGLRVSERFVQHIPGLRSIENSMPNKCFPLGAVHEMLCHNPEDIAATTGFTTALLSKLFITAKPVIWISDHIPVFTPGLNRFGVQAANFIFVRPPNAKAALWLTEEALQCNGVGAVVAELPEVNFLHSRRFQLAVEKTNVTGFLLNTNPVKATTNACVSRWHISHKPSFIPEGMPGVGFPQWKVELQKIRNGRKGNWFIKWEGQKFTEIFPVTEEQDILLPAKAI